MLKKNCGSGGGGHPLTYILIFFLIDICIFSNIICRGWHPDLTYILIFFLITSVFFQILFSGDGTLTENEFVDGCMSDEAFVKVFCVFIWICLGAVMYAFVFVFLL